VNREFPINLGKGMLTSTLSTAYSCPRDRVTEVTSIHLVNNDSIDHTIQCVPIISGGTVPYIPAAFVLKAKHTCELIDNPGGGPNLFSGDVIQLGSDISDKISFWVQGYERPIK
jgi:hypothetical protein